MIKTIILTDFRDLTGQLAKVNRKPDMPRLRDNVLANPSEGTIFARLAGSTCEPPPRRSVSFTRW